MASALPAASRNPRILHAKFAAYLGWSQPFIHHLVSKIGERCPSAVLTGRIENADRFPVDDFMCVSRKWLAHPASAWVIASHLRNAFAPQVLHAHFGWSGIRVLMLRQILDVPLVTTFGGRDAGTDLHDERLKPVYRLLLEQSARLICVSEPLRDDLIRFGVDPAKIEVIRRGTDTSAFAFVDRSARQGGFRMLMVGRLVEKKGHDLTLGALTRLRAEGIDASLEILGRGPLETELRQEVAARELDASVRFFEPTDVAGVSQRMAEADVLVQCSRTAADGDCEGIPNVVVEASATGLPVVGSMHGGIPETIRDGETGFLVPENDETALGDALLRLATQREERLAMGETAAKWMHSAWCVTGQVERHLEIYRNLIEDPEGTEPLPPDLPLLLEEALATPGHYDHRTMRVATLASEAILGKATDDRDTGTSSQNDDAPETRDLWQMTKTGVKTMLGPAKEPIVEWRRRQHYLRIRGRQRRIEDEVWEILRRAPGSGGPLSAARARRILRIVADESAGSLSI